MTQPEKQQAATGEILTNQELKKVTDRHNICAATPDYTKAINFCTDSAEKAEAHAGAIGWWCCNCQEAIDVCGSKE